MEEKYYFYIAIAFFCGLIAFGVSVIRKYSRKKTLSQADLSRFVEQQKKISKRSSYKQQIIEYDTLYCKILQALGYVGTFGEILKQHPNEIGDLDRVWALHKLRNKLVHEFDIASDSVLRKKVVEFEKEISFLLRTKK